jgi:hypothetical protein
MGLKSKCPPVLLDYQETVYITGRWFAGKHDLYIEVVKYKLLFIPIYEFVDYNRLKEIQGERSC